MTYMYLSVGNILFLDCADMRYIVFFSFTCYHLPLQSISIRLAIDVDFYIVWKAMAASHRFYEYNHLQANCLVPGSVLAPYARPMSIGLWLYLYLYLYDIVIQNCRHIFYSYFRVCMQNLFVSASVLGQMQSWVLEFETWNFQFPHIH